MARFDVHPTPTRSGVGYVVDVQADLLQSLDTRVVAPLLPPDVAPKPARELNPTFIVRGEPYVMLTQFIASVSVKELRKRVSTLEAHRDDITRALDVLLVGF